MVFTWCKIPNLWGLPLRLGSLWVAEIYGLLGIGLIIQGSDFISMFMQLGSNAGYEWLIGGLPTIIGVLLALTSICLIYGVYQNKPSLILLWIIVVTIVHIVIAICILAIFIITGAYNHMTLYGVAFLYAMIYIESQRFTVTGVYSYYKEMKGAVYKPVNKEMLQLPPVAGYRWALLASADGGNLNPDSVPPSVQGHHWVLKRDNADTHYQKPLLA